MMQSEHWGWLQAAASFAQAAMRQIEVVYSQDNAPESDADRADWTAQRQNQESMFCANLFVYALEGGPVPGKTCFLACSERTHAAGSFGLCNAGSAWNGHAGAIRHCMCWLA